jgi:hypothetical protein
MTAQCFAVNSNNDMYIGEDGNLAIVFNLEGTLQACAHAAKTILGEMVFSVNQGLPNFQLVWVGVPNLPQYEAAVRVAILAVDGVVEIVSFLMDISDNTLKYTITIRTIYGVGVVTNGSIG